MTKLPGFTLDLQENKQGQTFALILQQGSGLCVCVPSSPPLAGPALTWKLIYFNMVNFQTKVSSSHAALWALFRDGQAAGDRWGCDERALLHAQWA